MKLLLLVKLIYYEEEFEVDCRNSDEKTDGQTNVLFKKTILLSIDVMRSPPSYFILLILIPTYSSRPIINIYNSIKTIASEFLPSKRTFKLNSQRATLSASIFQRNGILV